MKKGVLIYCMCLLAMHGTAQNSAFDIPVVEMTTMDSVLNNTELTSLVRDNSKVILSWKNNELHTTDFVVVERSNGGRDYEVVAVIKQAGSSTPQNEWIDDAPSKGRNLYRIRFVDASGQPFYSKPVMALIAGDISFRFYPNPVDNILIIRSESMLDIQVVDAAGKVRISQSRLQGIQTINVTQLEKGLYFLRINNRATGILTQEKLLKN